MRDILGEMIALEEAARICIPLLAPDPMLVKYAFNIKTIILLHVEYDQVKDRKLVVLEPCGALSSYIAQILRETLAEASNIDAVITFHFQK